jgi:hypothetical protein
MSDEYKNGWREYSRFVLAMLERLDADVKKLQNVQEKCQQDMPKLKNDLFGHVDRKFEQLAAMHKRQVETATHELTDMVEAKVKQKEKEEAEVQVAAVTGSWEFRTAIATGLVSIIIALIALFT